MDHKKALDKWQRAKDEAKELRARADKLKQTADAIELLFEELNELMPEEPMAADEPSPTSAILEAAEMILASHGKPRLTGLLLIDLEGMGLVVGGGNPSSNLSAKLSQDRERFKNHGRGMGWGLVEWEGSQNEPGDTNDLDVLEELDDLSKSEPTERPQFPDDDSPF